MSEPRILFVDDDPDIQSAARLLLGRRGFAVAGAHGAEAALTHLATESVDLVLLDLNYAAGATGGAEGLALLRDIRARHPALPVLVVTGHSGVAVAVAAMRDGARDFVMKPWNNERLVALLHETLARHPPATETADTAETAMIAVAPAMRRLLDLADRLAPTRAHLLIAGPPGAGKVTLARRVQARSGTAGVLHILDAGHALALPPPVADATWILRDVDRLPPALQAELAIVLDASSSPRVLALTSAPVEQTLSRLEPRLRMQLDVVRLLLPPLRERGDEIDALARHFAALAARRHRRPAPQLTGALGARLRAAAWPQNLRELRQAMERLVLLGDIAPAADPAMSAEPPAAGSALARSERALIADALGRHGFNVSRAAQELGLSRPALYRRMARYGL